MMLVDRLSDTTYREQAVEQLDQLLDSMGTFPVKVTQIYGLRQIARQQPEKVEDFASHQRERAERKLKNASESAKPKLKDEIAFWELVDKLCGDSASNWSLQKEGYCYLPEKLREENIPARRKGMTHDEQRHRNELRSCQRKWLEEWKNEHIPAFFERFCTHSIYRLGLAENVREE